MALDRRSRPGASRSIPLNRASTASVFELPPRAGTVLGAKRRSSRVRLGRLLRPGFRLAARPSLELDPVGGVNEAVADGVGQCGLPDRLVPLLDGELAGDERGGPLVTVLEDLEEVAPFLVLERCQGEVVEDHQL